MDELFEVTTVDGKQKVGGVRLSPHFAWISNALTHLPTGRKVPRTTARTLPDALRINHALMACTFVDWSVDLDGFVDVMNELTDEQVKSLNAATRGEMPKAVPHV